MANNQFLNATVYAKSMLLLLKNNLVTGRLVDGQFKDQVTDENGLSINVKRPPRFAMNDSSQQSAALAVQDLLTGSVNIAVNQYAKVHISIGDIEYVSSYNALMQNETMKSAASTLAHQIDKFLQTQTLGFNSWVAGNATTGGVDVVDPTKPFASAAQAMSLETRLMNQGCPINDVAATVTPLDSELIRGALLSSFTPGLNVDALTKAKIPLISNVDFYATQQTPSLTLGTRAASGAALVNGANQNVHYRTSAVRTTFSQTIAVDSLTAGHTVKKGEVFTIASVYAWDWRNNAKLDYLQQFTVLADATADGGGAIAALSISPPIIVQGQNDGTDTNGDTAFATVDSIPADDANVTWAGTATNVVRVRSAWQKRAIALVSARLHMPFTGTASMAVDPDTGIAIRYWRGSDISTGNHIHRWDCIYGASVMDPFLGTRGCGS